MGDDAGQEETEPSMQGWLCVARHAARNCVLVAAGTLLWHFLSYGVVGRFPFRVHMLIVVVEDGLGRNGGVRLKAGKHSSECGEKAFCS